METPLVPHQIRNVFQGRIFSIVVESVTLPRGHTLDVELVRHPGSVVLIPVTDSGEIVLGPAVSPRNRQVGVGTPCGQSQAR